MPLYLRKTVSAGPFRFNLSSSGLGASVGVKGLRIGTGPRGHYISVGRGGLRYRTSLGKAGQSTAPKLDRKERSAPVATQWSGVEMIDVDSGDVFEMRDETFGAVLDDINASARKTRMAVVLPILAAAIALMISYGLGANAIALLSIAGPAWMLGKWLDSYGRATIIHYDLAGGTEAKFQRMTEAFDEMMKCAGTWHIEAGGVVRDLTTWKRNAGASHLVRRKPTTLTYELPQVVKSNVTPPALHVGRRVFFLFPDVVLIKDGNRFGAVGYSDLRFAWQDSNFIETERVPHDAQIVSHTWEHPNKSGGPDRRFKSNRQLPVCRYEALHLSSASGVNELVEFSRTGVSASFASATNALPKQSLPTSALALPSTQ